MLGVICYAYAGALAQFTPYSKFEAHRDLI